MNKLEQIKKKIFMSMKIMDTSIKGVKESQDYLLAQANVTFYKLTTKVFCSV